MAGELITFPIRVGLRAARVAARGGLQASERAIAIASFVVKTATSSGSRDDADPHASATEAQAAAPPRRPTAPASPSPTTPRPPAAEQVPPEIQPAPLETEPVHVSEEPTLVEEFAEPGAEDGAGAQVRIAEPWDGYADLNAADVIARLSDANAVELAAVQLYEAAHRNRETVMTAVERELRAKSGRGAATADKTRKEHTNGG